MACCFLFRVVAPGEACSRIPGLIRSVLAQPAVQVAFRSGKEEPLGPSVDIIKRNHSNLLTPLR
jgi:hypothetical protein